MILLSPINLHKPRSCSTEPRVLKVLASARSRVIVKEMARKRSTQREGEAAVRQPLQALRDTLLDLHKTLIDSERAVYENKVGPIKSPHHFFQLVSSDPWFAWLRHGFPTDRRDG